MICKPGKNNKALFQFHQSSAVVYKAGMGGGDEKNKHTCYLNINGASKWKSRIAIKQ